MHAVSALVTAHHNVHSRFKGGCSIATVLNATQLYCVCVCVCVCEHHQITQSLSIMIFMTIV